MHEEHQVISAETYKGIRMEGFFHHQCPPQKTRQLRYLRTNGGKLCSKFLNLKQQYEL